ncbi:MAG: hypothetical protein JWN61_1987 [Pseudonocardiales bacterium]|nr:hypothetical protein [Pseudonocardiales bacterium]
MAKFERTLAAGQQLSEIPDHQLWLGYVSIGGNMTLSEMADSINLEDIAALEHDLIGQAINDWCIDHSQALLFH